PDDRTGSFSHCSAGVVYDGGINLFVVSTEGHGWWLGFTSPQWSLTPSASTPVKLQFDERPPVEVLGTIADGQLLLVPAPDESHLIDVSAQFENCRDRPGAVLFAEPRSHFRRFVGAGDLRAQFHRSRDLPAHPAAG